MNATIMFVVSECVFEEMISENGGKVMVRDRDGGNGSVVI